MPESFAPPARTLMGPGPSPVSPDVLAALARPTIGHLDPAFVDLMDETKGLLQETFLTQNRLTMPVSGPGTAGMEACVDNLVEPGTTVVVCRNGVFGDRLRQMVERAGGVAVVVDAEWGRAVPPETLADALVEHPEAEVVAFVHAETSTGALSDAETLARIARDHGCLVVADTVTSLGGVPVRVDDWGLDAVYSGTQKCLAAPPGLSPVTFSDRALERMDARETPVQSWFLDVSLVARYWNADGAKRAYHHTAPVNMIYALHEALRRLQGEGLEAAWARHRRMHRALAAGLDALGLAFVVPEAERLPQLNAVWIPDGVDDAATRRRLLDEHGLEIGGGLGDLAGRAWRIGLMGEGARPGPVLACLGALEAVLDRSGGVEAAEPLLDAVAA
ncbi:alanine--glyoxylate aminotransferase family protein [Rubrivirga sp. S365]|uniref:Alanine--glyoxylate aminotransferase family protein n=1 Tax=Rubrivirga litoralis TaxID=3075598 RepID=A0ABU3BQJ9_9BACT|nr:MULTISPECIES: alanine--glyoxylate aminotransferase family protein [unclassified Rubrivirga]MDT0631535.1 alanine--glyoxylate aminotransferase family protein [Rubrivirga sp. F394]MDT7855482.1 alanine--glyoxylate aminotransferase family protein [Rubrivirga sp. S365]